MTVATNAWYNFWDVRPVLRSLKVVPRTVLDIIGTVINVIADNRWEVRLVYKNIKDIKILIVDTFEDINGEGHDGFIHDVSVTSINKTDGKTPTKWERP